MVGKTVSGKQMKIANRVKDESTKT